MWSKFEFKDQKVKMEQQKLGLSKKARLLQVRRWSSPIASKPASVEGCDINLMIGYPVKGEEEHHLRFETHFVGHSKSEALKIFERDAVGKEIFSVLESPHFITGHVLLFYDIKRKEKSYQVLNRNDLIIYGLDK
jgi:hypothetical protein